MRLARHGRPGAEQPLISGAGGVWRDPRPVVGDLTPATLPAVLAGAGLDALPAAGTRERFGPPPAGIGKIVRVGLNHREHAAETGAAVPGAPIVFLRSPDTVVGPDDPVLIPRRSVKTDHEAELAVVIGRRRQTFGQTFGQA
ncbi:fumarylacetoacetate hydrolase family protein [Streptomyces sp. NPDC002018]|uniref:fumarylacetoacetate hydrolase family protein n=1 Tax=Streptomyces sp. NPDC002018 TaxID=3364629 RepID=UPI00367C12E7